MTNETALSLKRIVGQQSSFLAPAVILLLAIMDKLPGAEPVIIGVDPVGEPTMGTIIRASGNTIELTAEDRGKLQPWTVVDVTPTVTDFVPQSADEVWARMEEANLRILTQSFGVPEGYFARDAYGRPRFRDNYGPMAPPDIGYVGDGSIEMIDPGMYWNGISVQEMVLMLFGSRLLLPPMTIFRIQAVGKFTINVLADTRRGDGLQLVGAIDFRASNVGYANRAGEITWEVMRPMQIDSMRRYAGYCTPDRTNILTRGAGPESQATPNPRCDCSDCRNERSAGGPVAEGTAYLV